jgi:hypothetical protein
MKKSVSKYEFCSDSALTDNFSYHGIEALFDWFEEYEDSCGEQIEYDPVAIRSDFTEFASIEEISNYYTEVPLPPKELDEDDDTDYEEEALEWLRDHTSVIVFEGGIILQDF